MSWLVLLALAAAPLPGGALLAEHVPHVLERARVGEWVTYRLDGAGGRDYFWRIAVVAEERDARGRPALWVELDVGLHPAMKAPIAQLKVLATREAGLSPRGVSRVFAAYGLERARELAPDELPRLLGSATAAPKPAHADVTVKRGRATRLLTAGGALTATPVEVRLRGAVLKRYWLSDAVPLLGLAKLELPAISHGVEVRDWGLDAQPQLAAPDPAAANIRMEGPR